MIRTFIAVGGLVAVSLPATAAGPDPILEALRAADVARQTEATEAQAWADEKARLELLLTSIEERIGAERRRRDRARAELRTLEATTPEPPTAALETGTAEMSAKIDDSLDALAQSVPPGLIPPRGTQRANPREALDQALHRLERAERAVKTVDVSVATGRLDGTPVSVEVIRLGGVAAWWRSLDGTAGGEAFMVRGQLELRPADDADSLEAIALASVIAKGRAAPQIVLLPVRHARTSTGAQP